MSSQPLTDSSLKYVNNRNQSETIVSSKSNQKKSRRLVNKKQQQMAQSVKQFEVGYQMMKNKAQSAVQNLPVDTFEFEEQCQFSQTRKKYCKQILKYLLVGYQEIVKQANMKKFYMNESQITSIISDFMCRVPNFTKAIQIFTQMSKQLQLNMFQFYNTAGSTKLQSHKYRLQIKYLIQNLSDKYNDKFRYNIVTGIYEPGFVSMLNQLLMMHPSKKQYIESGCANQKDLEPDYELIQRRREREKKYQAALQQAKRIKMNKDIHNASKYVKQRSIQYFLSNKFVEKLETQLMEIPERTFRKQALLSLNTTLLS